MIASLRGELIHKSPDQLIVDVGGVGYSLKFCQSGASKLPETGHELFIYVYMNVREDALDLYGFMAVEEKEIFVILLQVSGIGPKVALNILSAIGPTDLARAIRAEDLHRLTKLPGIGKKTAERLCLELKDKVQAIAQHEIATDSFDGHLDSIATDVVSALVNLGYSQAKARDAYHIVRQNIPEDSPEPSLEELLRLSLRSLA
jgi:Holliday junction DNA helicase RuvA